MKSNDEEYLDSLLNSAQSNNNNPQSALSRMASRSKQNTSGSGTESESGDLSALVENAGGNQDIKEIGNLLNKLDADELLDDGMAKLLDDIDKPSDASVPVFKVGEEPTGDDVRDPEEIALDEAIADAERIDESIKNGTYENFDIDLTQKNETPEEAAPTPIIDESEDVDSLLEMAPEISLPEESTIATEKDSDADQTPEEILTDLLDDMPGNSLTEPDNGGSLSDILDREQEQEAQPEIPTEDVESVEESTEESLADLNALAESADEALAGLDSIAKVAEAETELSEEPENMPTVDELASLMEGIEEITEGEESPEATENASEGGQGGVTPGIAITEDAEVVALDNSLLSGLEAISEDDINLDDLEASLDDLIATDDGNRSSIEGEIAELVENAPAPSSAESTPAPEESSGDSDISIPDLDALMNSLANDEVEDIESTAHIDEAVGIQEESEINKNDILGALTEEGFDNLGMEPSLGDLAGLDEGIGEGGADIGAIPKGRGSSREKKEGLLKKLLKTLTEEDEEASEANGELASLTSENQQVLSELGDEEPAPKKKKKEKKTKKEKPPKEKKPKKEKPPKPKKEKKPKPPKEPEPPGKAMAPKKIILSGIFAASFGILVCIPAFVLPNRIARESAQGAYAHQDYSTAYKLLYGKEMTSEESTVYEQSRVLAWSERYLMGYQNYKAMNMETEALDMLLMAKRNKDELLEEAQKFNVEIQVQSVYDSIESLLSENYGLSEEEISEINSIKKDRDYTIKLMEIVGTLES